jgi:hypothetical protein
LHVERLMRPLVVEALHEGVEARLLLKDIRGLYVIASPTSA